MSTPFMQLYVADYLGDTRHLTTEQHGAYLLLLMAMWRAGGFLPADDAKLARIVSLTITRWNRIKGDVMAFLTIEDGHVTQKRLRAELKKAEEKSQKRAEAGRVGGSAKALNNNNQAVANATVLPEHSSEPEPESEPESEQEKKEESSLRSERSPTKPVKPPKAKEHPRFAEFYDAYPLKKSRGAAVKAFPAALAKTDPETLIEGARRYAVARQSEDPHFTKHPATWLNQECWLDQEVNRGNQRLSGPASARSQQSFGTSIREAVRERGGGSLFDTRSQEIIDITPARNQEGDPVEETVPRRAAHSG